MGLYPHTVQIVGSLALGDGALAEMATGEGKTLSAALSAVLAGWTGKPCHIVTANDYLAERDAGWMGPLYRACGLSAGFITAELDNRQRREAYARDIAYTTGKELVADFLRDRLQLGRLQHYSYRKFDRLLPQAAGRPWPGVLRGLHTAIVDEADHILIDEAVTPVILSTKHKNKSFVDACHQATLLATRLAPGEDYRLDTRDRTAELTPRGHEKVEALAAEMPELWSARRRSEELLTTALVARHFYERGKQYVVEDGRVVIVDEFTGRLMPQRTWREGLHQAVEAKEGIALSDMSETSMRLSFQKFFQFFFRLSGMTGTAREASREFWEIYRLPVVTIPTHKPEIRRNLPARIFAGEEEKSASVIDEIRRVHESGRPVLVGVRTVQQSESLSRRLEAGRLPHEVLNATRHKEEANIILQAGKTGRITIATNMAGRGTDIILEKGVAEKGGLHVLATEFHEAGRIDRQLYGRTGRQGDPGSAVTFASMEDELAVRFLPQIVRQRAMSILKADAKAAQALGRSLFMLAQKKAEHRAYKQRKNVLQMDDWIEKSLSFASSEGHFL